MHLPLVFKEKTDHGLCKRTSVDVSFKTWTKAHALLANSLELG